METETNGRATVALVDAKLDGLTKLMTAEFANVHRRLDEVARLEPRVRQLEVESVRRVGPIIDEMREFETKVQTLDERLTELAIKSVTTAEVKTALAFDRDHRADLKGVRFSRFEKIAGLVFAAVLIGLNVYQLFG